MDGLDVEMDLLTPHEEAECQRYALEGIKSETEGEETETTNPIIVIYYDRMRACILAYAIKSINGEEIPNYIFVPSEKSQKGSQVRIEKHKAMIDIIGGWTRPLIHALFHSYGRMLEEVEIEADKYISYNPKNVDTQIAIVEQRLERLKQIKQQQIKSAVDTFSVQVKASDTVDEKRGEEIKDLAYQNIDKTTPPTTSDLLDTPLPIDYNAMMGKPPVNKQPTTQQPETNQNQNGSFSKPVADPHANYVPPTSTNNSPPEHYLETPKPRVWDEERSPSEVNQSQLPPKLDSIKKTVLEVGMDNYLKTISLKDQAYIRRFGLEKYAASVEDGSIGGWSDNPKRVNPIIK